MFRSLVVSDFPSRLSSLKFSFALVLSDTIVALWRWLRNNEWQVVMRTWLLLRNIRHRAMTTPVSLVRTRIIGVRGGGSGGVGSPPRLWKISGDTPFQGQAQVAQKSWMIKNTYSVLWIQAPSVFQGKRKLLKTPEWKGIFNTVKNFRATLFFQSKCKLLKNPEW